MLFVATHHNEMASHKPNSSLHGYENAYSKSKFLLKIYHNDGALVPSSFNMAPSWASSAQFNTVKFDEFGLCWTKNPELELNSGQPELRLHLKIYLKRYIIAHVTLIFDSFGLQSFILLVCETYYFMTNR